MSTASDVIAGRATWAVEQGDALDLLLSLPADSVGAVVTDPPYSSGGMYRGDRVNYTSDEKYTNTENEGRRPNFSGDNMDSRSWKNWTRRWLRLALRVAEPGGYLLCFTDWRQLPTLTDVIQWSGWVWRGVLVWDKTEAAKGPHTGYFGYQCEFIAWATKGQPVAKPSLPEGGEGRMSGCYRRAVSAADKHHQTGKPTDVMRWLVRCCPPGGIVLDPFVGSGTTLVAALQTGRRGIGFEMGADYTEIARRRVAGEPLKVGDTPYSLFAE